MTTEQHQEFPTGRAFLEVIQKAANTASKEADEEGATSSSQAPA